MRLGVVILPEDRWHDARELWRGAEVLGIHHAWTYDHLGWHSLRDEPWFASIPTLTAAALATTRIRLGTLVASPNFRHPVPFAKEVMTLDDISAGRLTLGLGSGGLGWDATMLGHDPWGPAERAGRFEEFAHLLDLLLRQQRTTWHGSYYAADEARSLPGCRQRPRVPFAIAATAPLAMAVAARFGQSWVTTGLRRSYDEWLPAELGAWTVKEQLDQLETACARVGREAGSLHRMVLSGISLDPGLSSVEQFQDTLGRYEDVGITDFVVHWPRRQPPFQGSRAAFEKVIQAALAGTPMT